MKILHINNVDLLGNRFNGHDMQIALNKRGIEANQVVMERMGNDEHTILLADNESENFLRRRIMECEKNISLHAMIYPYLFKLMEQAVFQQADVVHYHLLHNYFGALPILPEITRKKPSVLTVHDPWIFTGHCIYPLQCDKWQTGCGNCERLDVNFSMLNDRTALQWEIKKSIFLKANMDIIVASEYMLRLLQSSPITKHLTNVHVIPFGIDTEMFSLNKDKAAIRRRLGIPEENFVICFRADPSVFKGFGCIKDMLKKLHTQRAVSLIAVGNPGMLISLQGKYQILDLGWVTDDNLMADLYCASDVFLMPSTAEAFGLMAIEAMASGCPVVVCEGTSLPGVTFAPQCGVVIPQNDSIALCEVVTRLINDPEECRQRGALGRTLAEKHYRFDDYIEKHIKLYEKIIRRKKI